MTDLMIRKAVQKDVDFLWEMLYLSLFTAEGQEPFNRDIIKEPSISKYVDGWGRDGDVGFIALIDGKPVGSVIARLFCEDNKGYGFIDSETPELGMALIPEYRGKGIGTELLKSMLKELRCKGIVAISLSVDLNNPAIRLYERFGFVPTGAVVDTSITMRLCLE
jgi:ribosomal protein S18 acetylase RimI-like enzyme